MHIAVFGATSEIAAACLHLWAARGDSLHLFSRNLEKQAVLAGELRNRWQAEVREDHFDAEDKATLPVAAKLLEQAGVKADIILLAFGYLGENEQTLHDPTEATRVTQVNYTATVDLLTSLLPLLEQERGGKLAVISSVAGERGRSGLVVYGAAKAGVTAYLAGLRGWLFSFGIRVTIIKPGIIRTAMTAHLPASPLISTPEKIAPAIVRAIDRGKHQLFVPGFWRLIMWLVRIMPEAVIKRISR